MRVALPRDENTGALAANPGPLHDALAEQARRPLADVALAERLSPYGPLLGTEDGKVAAERAAAPLVAGLDTEQLARAGADVARRLEADPHTIARVLHEARHPIPTTAGAATDPAADTDERESRAAQARSHSEEQDQAHTADRLARAVAKLGDPTDWRSAPSKTVDPEPRQVATWQNQLLLIAPAADLSDPAYRSAWTHAAGADAQGTDPTDAITTAAHAVHTQPTQDPEAPSALFLRTLDAELARTPRPDQHPTGPVPWLDTGHRQAVTHRGEWFEHLETLHTATTERAWRLGATAAAEHPAWMGHTQPRPDDDAPHVRAEWDRAIAAVASYRDAHHITTADPDAPLGPRPHSTDPERAGYDTTAALWRAISGPTDPERTRDDTAEELAENITAQTHAHTQQPQQASPPGARERSPEHEQTRTPASDTSPPRKSYYEDLQDDLAELQDRMDNRRRSGQAADRSEQQRPTQPARDEDQPVTQTQSHRDDLDEILAELDRREATPRTSGESTVRDEHQPEPDHTAPAHEPDLGGDTGDTSPPRKSYYDDLQDDLAELQDRMDNRRRPEQAAGHSEQQREQPPGTRQARQRSDQAEHTGSDEQRRLDDEQAQAQPPDEYGEGLGY
jgi:hypothetical protein